MAQTPIHPKLLLEFYKGQTIPKLVSKHDRQHTPPLHYDRLPKSNNKRQKSHSVNSIHSKRTVGHKNSQSQIQDVNRLLQVQRMQNLQLRQMIKQLTVKSDRLREINEDLLVRIKEVQSTYDQFVRNSNADKREAEERIKVRTYKQLQTYLKSIVEKFAQALSKEKMSPMVEQKIQNFLEQLLQVNPFSVQHEQKRIKNQSIKLDQQEIDQTIRQLLENQNKYKTRVENLEKSNYYNLFRQMEKMDIGHSHLNSRQEYEVDRERSRSGQKQIMLGTPDRTSKRPKIFNKKYITEVKHRNFNHSDLQY